MSVLQSRARELKKQGSAIIDFVNASQKNVEPSNKDLEDVSLNDRDASPASSDSSSPKRNYGDLGIKTKDKDTSDHKRKRRRLFISDADLTDKTY